MQTMMHEQSGLPSYDETTPLINPAGGEIPTVDDLQKRLDGLRENRITGLLDTTKVPDANVNPLSEEEKKRTNQKSEKIDQSKISQCKC